MTGEPAHDGESALAPHPILLYDGVCGLCNRGVQFILRRDPEGVFRFAALQSPLAGRVLGRHGVDARDLDTVYVVVDYETPGERVVARSDAVVFALNQLAAAAELRSAVPTQANATQATLRPRLWRLAALFLRCIPRTVRDWGYGIVARYRYRLFGRYKTCPLPSESDRGRFLDV